MTSRTIVEAVENLSTLADLDERGGANVEQARAAVKTVKDSFNSVLDYLENHFKKDSHEYEKTLDGMKTLMVLADEAAKKVDKVQGICEEEGFQSILECPEYRKLNEFYRKNIYQKIDQSVIGQWLLEISHEVWGRRRVLKENKHLETSHVYIDLDSVKKDEDYELLLLKKEDGTRFFSPKLIRNIKLISDFRAFLNEDAADDPLVDMDIWKDRFHHYTAKSILDEVKPVLDKFYKVAIKAKHNELISYAVSGSFGLMMAANSTNLLKNNSKKCCSDYFEDFLHYLKMIVRSHEFQKLTASPHINALSEEGLLIETVHAFSQAVFKPAYSFEPYSAFMNSLFERTEENREYEMWSALQKDYGNLVRILKKHRSGPLTIFLDGLENGSHNTFRPITRTNVPSLNFNVVLGETIIPNIRMPSPTLQEYVHKAYALDEFKTFLKARNEDHLMFNFQDRTSWKDISRIEIIENLHKQFKNFTFINLPYDTEFYWQENEYSGISQAETFISIFLDQVLDDHTGFLFPEDLKVKLAGFLPKCLDRIHKIFFGGRNVLTLDERKQFIDLVYQMIMMKAIDVIHPSSFSLCCKDGLDVAPSASAVMFVLIHGKIPPLSERYNELRQQLFIPALITRERPPMNKRFKRLISTLKLIETTYDEHEDYKKKLEEELQPLFESQLSQVSTS